MTYAEVLQEAKDICKECLTVNDCAKEECRCYWIIKALEIADRLEQADAEEMAIRIGCSNGERSK